DDAVIDSRFRSDPHFDGMPFCSLLAVPVFVRGRFSVYLTLENRLFRAAFTSERVEIVSALSSQLAISIENVRLYQSLERKVAERTSELSAANCKLQQLSECDGLTGLANRRKLDMTLEIEWRRAVRQERPMSIAILDIDKFKAYNDHYGHQAGDDCLHRVASVLNATVRRSGELAARYGGEEFVVILPGLGGTEACEMAQRIRAAVENQAIPHAGSPVIGVVTVSIGVVSQVPGQKDNLHGLLKRADAALYQAKEQGRNLVVLAE
ncbi:MAG: diguanylate cyclase, partial [Deltaproteobacteria bacterium]|nr:diguanylate cyclase [Deltaproteobacteria bacterium]